MTVVSGDSRQMVLAGTELVAMSDPARSEVRELSRLLAEVERRCEGIVVTVSGSELDALERRWSLVDRMVLDVGNRFLAADRDTAASIRANGIQTSADARFIVHAADLASRPLDDPSVAAVMLMAIAPIADAARDRIRDADAVEDGTVSVGDLRALTSDATATDVDRDVAQRLLEYLDGDSARREQLGLKGDGWSWSQVGSVALDAAGFVPVVGDVIDASFMLYHLSQGEWEEALLSGVGLVPIPGVSGTGIRATKQAAEELAQTFTEAGTKAVVRDLASETAQAAGVDRMSASVGDIVETVTGSELLGEVATVATDIRLDAEVADTGVHAVADNVASILEVGFDIVDPEPDTDGAEITAAST